MSSETSALRKQIDVLTTQVQEKDAQLVANYLRTNDEVIRIQNASEGLVGCESDPVNTLATLTTQLKARAAEVKVSIREGTEWEIRRLLCAIIFANGITEISKDMGTLKVTKVPVAAAS